MSSASRPLPIRAIDRVGRALGRFGVHPVRLEPDAIERAAIRKARCDDFGDDGYRGPLEILCRSTMASPSLSIFGRAFVRQTLVHRLTNRLMIEREIARRPQILDETVERPVFIVSPPRTGTTVLHRLLAEDRDNRVLRQWEIDHPCPPPEEATYETDPRIAQTAREIRVFDWLAPQFKSIHELGAELPEECIGLFANDLLSVWFTVGVDLPEYRSFYQKQDLLPLYRRHRRQLQVLQSRYRGARWVLKAPMHLLGLGALLETYPDARVVMTHRDPLRVLASEASLFATMRSAFHARVDKAAIGRELLEDLAGWCARALEARTKAEADPSSKVELFDLAYSDIVADPLAAVERLYDRFGLTPGPGAMDRMRRYLEANRQHKHGRHRYSLEEFGVSDAEARAAFAPYCERFGIEMGAAG